LVGKALDAEAIGQVSEAVEKEVQPRDSYDGSEAYRREMAGLMARRALAGCMRGESDA